MHTSFYNIPRQNTVMYGNRRAYYNNRFGGNFIVPFILGGITGATFANHPYPYYAPYPYYYNHFYPYYPYYYY